MKKNHSRIGFTLSLLAHTGVFAGIWLMVSHPSTRPAAEDVSSISMEMMAAILEQPAVAIAADDPIEEEKIEELLPELDPIPEPLPEPPKPKAKPKEEPKKPEKPKEKVKKVVKAKEKGKKPQEGVVAKAIPDAIQGTKEQIGIKNGNPNGTGISNGTSSGGMIDVYRSQLQKSLQRYAMNSYPKREQLMRRAGVVTIALSVDSTGQVVNVTITHSSGNENLDKAAVRAAQSVKMKTAPPAGFPNRLTVPIRFSID
ncbi:outer membrane transport energization protein TonB [Nicoletella semolina]|uniref:Protein TonB n=1 Tax=Nicoletella semolina TaxID=271160 RepID=A0A4R2N7J6_9PAST|nr:energy transducer TonB [Nicoletella semolina]MDH2924392.1 energy transducer TonB [Nicoletella semolina]TCP16828.1 outer membrane transport energization protein TonB [Nicoletella semolina]